MLSGERFSPTQSEKETEYLAWMERCGRGWNNTAGVGQGSIFTGITRRLFCKLKTEGQVARHQGQLWGRGSRTLNVNSEPGKQGMWSIVNDYMTKHYLESDEITQRQLLWKTGPPFTSGMSMHAAAHPKGSQELQEQRTVPFPQWSAIYSFEVLRSNSFLSFSFFGKFYLLLTMVANQTKHSNLFTNGQLRGNRNEWVTQMILNFPVATLEKQN